jgi:uncharacterized membrane protein YfcA
MLEWLPLLIVGFVSNAFSSLSGGGTGLLQLPAIIWLGLPFTVALATHKVTTIAMGAGAAFYAYRHRSLNRSLMLLILFSGLPGVLLGAHLVLMIPEKIGLFVLGILNISLSLFSIFNRSLGQENSEVKALTFKHHIIGGVVLFLIGIINGSLTSGTGLMVTLWLVLWYGLDYRRAIQHMLVIVGIFWNATGAVSLAFNGEVNWQWVIVLFPGALIGSWYGVYLGGKIDNRHIKKLFEVVAICAGIQLIMESVCSTS